MVASEAGLRWGLGLGRPALLQADPEIGYLFQPDQRLTRFGRRVVINGYHQRTGPVEPRPPAGTLRVLCVGDSVTFGGTLTDQAETYPELLAARLRETHRDGPVEVLNASAGSWGLGNEAAYLRRFGTFGSRWVVLQIGTHDLTQEPSTGAVVGVADTHPDRNPPAALIELFTRYVRPRLVGNVAEPALPPPPERPADASLADNLARLADMVRQTREAGGQPLVLHTPNRDEVTGAALPNPADESRRTTFLDRCRQLVVPVVNLRSEWATRPDAVSFYRDEVHLNPAGNRAVADRLALALP
ncbi:SGNH/GDSL hydrolase family protein [Brasilonema bromeliae]|uniref:SGNH/GDSL hydrolase family protein n=1 Tax=Brasilonema bromeliae SPC951 TaxID=385972 RepID=A0ABX1P7P9_9CYAN|nr:SGNH/GDSL hydrolase family protein [Brasilonema bromeliae]NMG20376.1 SGNH/GDSL hydrolase family protein [Brasilonema bromeliae SPC951]